MAKIEHGEGILDSFNTDRKTLRFREIKRGVRTTHVGEIPESPHEFELPYGIELEVGYSYKDYEDLKKLLEKIVKYVLSDGYVVDIDIKEL